MAHASDLLAEGAKFLMRSVLMGAGGLIFAVGTFLWWGNRSQSLPTFPYSGIITMGLGAALIAYSRGLNVAQDEKGRGGKVPRA